MAVKGSFVNRMFLEQIVAHIATKLADGAGLVVEGNIKRIAAACWDEIYAVLRPGHLFQSSQRPLTPVLEQPMLLVFMATVPNEENT